MGAATPNLGDLTQLRPPASRCCPAAQLLRHGLEGLSGLRRLALTINPVAAFTPRAPELTEAVVRARLQCPQPAHVLVRYARSSF